jgi:ABC-2 type transport system permease protein
LPVLCTRRKPRHANLTASAARALTLGTPATSYILQSLAWVAGILLVFVPIAIRRYRRAL